MKTYTAVITEDSSPYPPVSPWPLIYAVELEDPRDLEAALDQITGFRVEDIGRTGDLTAKEMLAIRDGITVHFVFEGDLTAAADFRE